MFIGYGMSSGIGERVHKWPIVKKHGGRKDTIPRRLVEFLGGGAKHASRGE